MRQLFKKIVACVLCCSFLIGFTPDIAEAKLTYISDLPRESFINYSNDVSANKKIQAMVDKLPDYIVYAIQTNDYHIHASNDGEDYGGSFGGIGICSGDYIGIKKSLLNQQLGKTTVYHEIGHAYDNCVSKTYSAEHKNEFEKIYEKEKNKIRILEGSSYSHTRSSASEYFAESFAIYMLDAKLLKKYVPETYKYLAKVTKKSVALKYANAEVRRMTIGGNDVSIQPQTSSSAVARSRQSNYCIAIKYLPSKLFKDLLSSGWRTEYTGKMKSYAKLDTSKKRIYINDALIQKKNQKHANLMVQKTIAQQCIQAYLVEHPVKGVDQKKLSSKMVAWLFHADMDQSYAKQIRKLCKNSGSTTAQIKKVYVASPKMTSKVTVVKKYYDSKTKECTKAKLRLTYDMGQGILAGLYADDYASEIFIEGDDLSDYDYTQHYLPGSSHKGQYEFIFNSSSVSTYEYSIVSEYGGRYYGKFTTDFVKRKETEQIDNDTDDTSDTIDNDYDIVPVVTFDGYPSGKIAAGTEVTMQMHVDNIESTVNLNGKLLGDGAYGNSFTFTVSRNGSYYYAICTKAGRFLDGVLKIDFFEDQVNNSAGSSDSTDNSGGTQNSDGVEDPINQDLVKG